MRTLKAFLVSLVLLAPVAAQEPAPAATPAREPGLYARLETSAGVVILRLLEKEAPQSVANFVALANGKKPWTDTKTARTHEGEPFFDGLIFHRVIDNFMSQTGGYTPDGFERESAPIADEFQNGLKYDRPGRVGMAHGGPGTATNQFFITHVPYPRLDGRYTIFAQVVEGQEVVNGMAKGQLLINERGERAIPFPQIVLKSVTIERVE